MKYVKNKTDGTLGLAPFDKDPAKRDLNFLHQLYTNKYIDQMVFSIYMKMDNRSESHIKFGGYDEQGALNNISNNKEFKWMRTTDKDTWRIKMRSAGLYEYHDEFGGETADDERFV